MIERLRLFWVWIVGLSLAPVLLLTHRNLWIPTIVLGLTMAIWRPGYRLVPPIGNMWLAVIGLVIWGYVAFLWSDYPAGDWLVEPILVLLLSLLIAARPGPYLLPMTTGVALALVVLLADAVSGHALKSAVSPDSYNIEKIAAANGRAIGMILLLVPGTALYLYRTQHLGVGRGLIILAAFAAASSPVNATTAAFAAALATGFVTVWRPSWGLRLIGLVSGVALAAPFFLAALLPPIAQTMTLVGVPESWIHRLIIWRVTLDHWLAEGVLFGTGAQGTRALSEATGRVDLATGTDVALVSLHAHNIPIEVLHDYGLVGYSLLIIAVMTGIRSLLRANLPRDMATAVTALIAAIWILAAVDTTIWNIYHVCAAILGAYLLKAVHERRGR